MTTKRLFVTFTLGLGLTLALLWSLNGAPLPTVRAATFTVTNTDDSGAGSLRQALALAGDGDTIDFALTYPATITLSSELIVSESITIAGPGAEQLFIAVRGQRTDGHEYLAAAADAGCIAAVVAAGAELPAGLTARFPAGVIAVENVVFFVVFALVFLILNTLSLEGRKY